MEENSELHETNVSSTTSDVPESQQVTGIHGNVETVIVVEELKEEDDVNSNSMAEPSHAESKDTHEAIVISEFPPEKDQSKDIIISANKETQRTYGKQRPQTKSEDMQKTPVKSDNAPKTPINSEIMQKALSKSDHTHKTPTSSEPIQKTPTKSNHVQKTPTNSEHVQKTPKKTDPVKRAQSNSEQVQETLTKADQVHKISNNIIDVTVEEISALHTCPSATASVQKSVTKETPLSEKSPNKQETSKKSPEKLSTDNTQQSAKESPNKEPLEKPNLIGNCSENATEERKEEEQINKTSDKFTAEKKDENKEEIVLNSSPMDICEKSNDSQIESNLASAISEKDHNKSISRELKSLIKSAKDSKIISECTQLTSKTRKSRAALDSSNTSLNTSLEADKLHVRRSSVNSQKSSCSEKSEKAPIKRSMRSQNPEFVNKVKQFLNSVTGKIHKGETDEEEVEESKKERYNKSMSPSPKKKRLMEPAPSESTKQQQKLRSDLYCWRCHWAVEHSTNEKGHPPLHCTVCPRSFHYKCLSGNERNKTTSETSWVCPECLIVLHAESSETRSPAMKKISLGLLCELLQYALERMMDLNGVEPFLQPVDRTAFPDYDKYVALPMDLSLMKKNIEEGLYGSTEAFTADALWILHNSIIFNTLQSKLTAGARALVRSCRAEMGEIEACPECYAAAHARRPTWFTDVCSTPHILLWAKLKGFPHWPAKGMSVNSQGLVDVRFFGAHDRAWVPAKDCFLYCEKDPNNFKAKRQDILDSMQEAEEHIRNISRKYGKFLYAPFKTQLDPTKLTEQLQIMIPAFEGEVRTQLKEKSVSSSPSVVKEKRRSNSKSSKSSVIDGDASENEEAQTAPPRKMADGAEIAREDEDFSIAKNKPMDVDEQNVQNKEKESSRKRRRSVLEEAIITIITSSSSDKRKKVENENKNGKKTETAEEAKGKTEENLPKNDKSAKTADITNNKINDKEVPSTPTITGKDIPTNKVEKVHIVTSTPVKTTPKGRPTKTSTPKEKDDKAVTVKHKPEKLDKSLVKEKRDENLKSQKRRNSRHKSLNSSQVGKSDKTAEKKNDKDNLSSNNIKDKIKETNLPTKIKESEVEKTSKPTESTNKPSEKGNKPEKTNKPNSNVTDSPKSVKDRIQFDDDTSLAVIARESAKNTVIGLPTISSVRSLSTTAQSTNVTTKTATNSKTIEIIVPANSDSSVFTPTSTDNVTNMKEAVDKLQKLRNESGKPTVGRVGVRAFARMTSPPAPTTQSPEKQKPNETVEVEVKSEPIDFEDADRQVAKMDLMKACHLRPVNPFGTTSLRDVRINKVVVTPMARKAVMKTTEVRIRARKTFPQPRKDGSDGRSELNGKNSMVYIPIQPPSTQAPVQRTTRPITINGSVNTQTVRPQVSTSLTNSIVNTLTTPLVPMTSISSTLPTPTPTTSIATTAATIPSSAISVPTVGQVPTTVHTVPLITSVNGQWTFSLQPVMSVGSDGSSSPPTVNGLPERNPPFVPIAPTTPLVTPLHSSPALLPTNTNNNNNSNNTEKTPGELPRLQQRPPLINPLDPNAPSGVVPVPSTAGPLTAKLSQNAVKLADFFRNLLEDSLEKIDDPTSQATLLRMHLEQAQWRHQQEVNELKHNHELLATELRLSFEKEKARAISEVRRVAQAELEAAVKLTKAKQWCANCSQEAQFYCCWNTSYCDYSCQRAHWSQHFPVCTQQRNADTNTTENGNSLDKRLQPAPENLPKSTAAPTLSVGTKLTPTRVYAQDGHQQKTSFLVSMVEDQSGNQMMKCVGTYKSTSGTQPVAPLIINKQIMNNDENAAKKVMTSGGYLIVGASNTTTLATTRRTHPVQYTYST